MLLTDKQVKFLKNATVVVLSVPVEQTFASTTFAPSIIDKEKLVFAVLEEGALISDITREPNVRIAAINEELEKSMVIDGRAFVQTGGAVFDEVCEIEEQNPVAVVAVSYDAVLED